MDEKPAITQEQLDALKKELQKDAVEDLVVETYQPKKNCRKCHGLGRIGFVEGDPNKPYYCNCIVKIKKALKTATVPVTQTPEAKADPVIIQDNSVVATGVPGAPGVGPCPTGVAGDSKASV